MFNLKAFVLLFCIGFTCAQIAPLTGWSSCASGPNAATGVSIGVSGCTSSPCTFYIGQSYTFTVYALSAVNSTSVPFTVSAAFPAFGTFDFIQDEGCGVLLLGTCPIKSGNLYLANFTYNVSHFTYLGYAVMQINVNDDSHNTIICAQFFGIIAQK